MATVLYLIQAKSDMPAIYECLRNKDHLLLSYQEKEKETDIFFPHSTWTTGRNRLRKCALNQKKYDYYVFLDCDLKFKEMTQDEGFNKFEEALSLLNYPIITPTHWGYHSVPHEPSNLPKELHKKVVPNNKYDYQTVAWFDGAINAFRQDVFFTDKIFPYLEEYDHDSWWASQFGLILLANHFFKEKIVQINTIEGANTMGSNYPRGDNSFFKVYETILKKLNIPCIEMSTTVEVIP